MTPASSMSWRCRRVRSSGSHRLTPALVATAAEAAIAMLKRRVARLIKRRVGLTLGLGRSLMHGVAPQMCGRVASPLLGRGAGGRSPGYLMSASPRQSTTFLCRLDRGFGFFSYLSFTSFFTGYFFEFGIVFSLQISKVTANGIGKLIVPRLLFIRKLTVVPVQIWILFFYYKTFLTHKICKKF